MRGYHSRKDLLKKGWEHVAELGRDMPTQARIRAEAKTHQFSVLCAGAWRLGDGTWHLFKNDKSNKPASDAGLRDGGYRYVPARKR